MHVLVFEDLHVDRLRPLSLCRPFFTISCGGRRLIDQLSLLGGPITAVIRPYLKDLVAADSPHLLEQKLWENELNKPGELVLFVNSRLVPSVENRLAIEELIDAGREGVVKTRQGIAVALCKSKTVSRFPEMMVSNIAKVLEEIELPGIAAHFHLIEYPHDVVRYHLATIGENLTDLASQGPYQKIARGVYHADHFEPDSKVVFDSQEGPIVIEKGVELHAFCVLKGPLYLGQNATVREHATICGFTSIGEHAKVGGEVLSSIVEPYSNKQHHGFLGHSYLGSWVNIGAGTNTSNLKNTYGNINVQIADEKVGTNMQFLGAIVGDFTKTAINSSIYTGKTIGVASTIYGTVTENVPSFVNYAKSFGQVTIASTEVVAKTQERTFLRRNRRQRPCDRKVLESAFETTAIERQPCATVVGPPKF